MLVISPVLRRLAAVLVGAALACAALVLTPPALAAAAQAAASQQTASQTRPPGGSVLEDPFVREQGKRGLDLLYNMQFAEAEAIFDQISARYPDHPIGPFMSALSTWWQILLDLDDTSHDDAFYDQMDTVLERADRLLDRDPDNVDAAFFKGAAYGFRGRLRSNRGKWFRSALDAKRAMDYVLEVAEEDPSNADFVFGKGIYDYYAAILPERYPLAKPLMVFLPEGNRERGLAELQRTAENGWYIQTEATYFLLQIHYLYEEDFAKSQQYVRWLRREHPNNPYFHNFEGRVYGRWGRWGEARRIFADVLARYEQGQTGYNDAMAEQALYYTARSYMAYGEWRTALNHLVRLDRLAARANDEDTYYKVLGRLRQGMVYDALGQRVIAKERYRQVLGMEDFASAHERAQKYLDDPYGR